MGSQSSPFPCTPLAERCVKYHISLNTVCFILCALFLGCLIMHCVCRPSVTCLPLTWEHKAVENSLSSCKLSCLFFPVPCYSHPFISISWLPLALIPIFSSHPVQFPTHILLSTSCSFLPSVLWCCWLGGRKGIRPVKNWVVGVLAWLSVWSKVQTL